MAFESATAIVPASNLTLYARATEPPILDVGFAREVVLRDEAAFGTGQLVTYNSRQVFDTTVLRLRRTGGGEEHAVMFPTPVDEPQATFLADWSATGGTYKDLFLPFLREYTRCLAQADVATAKTVLTSKFAAPPDPWVAVWVALAGWPDTGVTSRYWRFVFGQSPRYAFETDGRGKGWLCRENSSSQWEQLTEFSWDVTATPSNEVLWIGVVRRRLIWSVDTGKTWDVYEEGDPYDPGFDQGFDGVRIKSAVFSVESTAGRFAFGLHPLKPVNGVTPAIWTSPVIPIIDRRETSGNYAANWSYTLEKYEPTVGGATGTVSAASHNWTGGDNLYFRITFTPASTTPALSPWAFWLFPECYSVLVETPPVFGVAIAGSNTYLAVLSADIDYPRDLDEISATVKVMWALRTVKLGGGYTFYGQWRERLATLQLGYHKAAGSDMATMITGHIIDVQPSEALGESDGDVIVTLKIVGRSHRGKKAAVDETWKSLDGMLITEALDYCMKKIGYSPGATNRDWTYLTPARYLREGPPESRTWPVREGRPVWDVMRDICLLEGQEIFETESGIITTRWLNSFDGTSVATLQCITSADLFKLVESIQAGQNYENMHSGVRVVGADFYGNPVHGYAIYYPAEEDGTSVECQGYRSSERIEGENFVDASEAANLAAARLNAVAITHREIHINLKGGFPNLRRRQIVRVAGSALNLATLDLGVVGVQHHWGPGLGDCRTNILAMEPVSV